MTKLKNEIGNSYGFLTVESLATIKIDNRLTWNCICKCGGKKQVTGKALRIGNVTSCGCVWRQRPKGELSHAWKGGVYVDNHDVRTSATYKRWRKSILERDDFTCKVCYSTSSLEVHHITNFYKHVNERFEEKNAITLCKNCHKTFHSKFGNKHNSYFQLVLFFKGNK